jgi:hypothetical protein
VAGRSTSRVLAAISLDVSSDELGFLGDTVLSWTCLVDAWLREDIELIALVACREVAALVERTVGRSIASSHDYPTWQPRLAATTGSQPSALVGCSSCRDHSASDPLNGFSSESRTTARGACSQAPEPAARQRQSRTSLRLRGDKSPAKTVRS